MRVFAEVRDPSPANAATICRETWLCAVSDIVITDDAFHCSCDQL